MHYQTQIILFKKKKSITFKFEIGMQTLLMVIQCLLESELHDLQSVQDTKLRA